MKKINLLISLCVLFFCTMAYAADNNVMPVDKIAAVVNDSVITQSQVDRQVTLFKQQMQQGNQPLPPDSVIQKQIVDQMINRQLELQAAKRANLQATDAEVDKAVQAMAKQAKKTADQLYEEFQRQGWTKDDFKREMQDEVTIQKLQGQAVASQVQLSPEEMKQAGQDQLKNLSSYHIGDILIPTQEKADEVYKYLEKNPSAFTSKQTADLGWRMLTELPTQFVEQVSSMSAGEISKPIQAPNGFHIIKLIAKKGASITESQAREMLFEKKFQEQLEKFITQLRSQAYIKIVD